MRATKRMDDCDYSSELEALRRQLLRAMTLKELPRAGWLRVGVDTPESVAARAGWEAIAAVANQAVYAFDPFLVSVPGPRMVDGLEAMAKILHPEAFE